MKDNNCLEILSIDLLEQYSQIIESFRERARALGIQLGWHYDLDLAWLGSQLKDPSGMRILEAGAGTGVLQWWLADRGAEVVSVDRLDRADLSGRFRMAYQVDGVRSEDFLPTWKVVRRRLSQREMPIGFRIRGGLRAAATMVLEPLRPKPPGRVTLYRQDLGDLSDLQDESFDAVVSASALEHNDVKILSEVVIELMRVLKPGSLLLATLPAARDRDWYHGPSQGWCLTESTLRKVFALTPECKSNFSEYDSLFRKIQASVTLRNQLAPMAHETGEGGMPWGIWDPQYQPVGVRKIKQ